MKIVVPVKKPRAKWLNDILMSKRAERLASAKHKSRSKQKAEVDRELANAD